MKKEFQRGQSEFQTISLNKLMAMIRAMPAGKFDMVIGIERGGILPAYLASRWLDVPLETIPAGEPSARSRHPHERLTSLRGMRVLLVDDVSKTGATLRRAAGKLKDAEITSMVISGEADISLLGPHERCIRWPWDK